MKRPPRRRKPTRLPRIAVLALLTVPIGAALAMDPRPTNGPIAPRVAGPDAVRLTDFAATVRTRVAAARQKAALQRSARAQGATVSQAAALARLYDRAASVVLIRMDAGTGTPRLIVGDDLHTATGLLRGGHPGGANGATAAAFLSANRELLAFDDPSAELVYEKTEVCVLGQPHLRFSQRIGGVRVWPADLVVHLDVAGNVDGMTGSYVPTPRVTTRPAISRDAAVLIAQAELGGDSEAEESELIVYAPGDRATRLAWKLTLVQSLVSHIGFVIDAATGAVLNRMQEACSTVVAGSGVDQFGQTVPLDVWQDAPNSFFLIDASKPMFNAAIDPVRPGNANAGAIYIFDNANGRFDIDGSNPALAASSNPNNWPIADAVSASRSLSRTYNYYFDTHQRDSLDGAGGSIFAIVRYDRDLVNAFWNGSVMIFGDALPFPAALDVTGHELTHGVTQHSASLIYQNQSGALNEAFSDIFGECVEARFLGGPDWLKGGPRLGFTIQNYADPNTVIVQGLNVPHPARMSQFVQLPPDPDNDNGGVHINSSIINHAFYLLADGLPSGPIGIPDAEQIFYRALTVHLTANAQFIDCRLACIQSATELFGANSTQVARTAQAFDAVEIFDGSGSPAPAPDPAVEGADSTVFIALDAASGTNLIGRREDALGDGELGIVLNQLAVAPSRPSVTADGSLVLFVGADNDLCLQATDASAEPECLGLAGQVHSVAITPSGDLAAFILNDANGDPSNVFTLIDLTSAAAPPRQIELTAASSDAAAPVPILFADALTFSPDGGTLVYDALNQLRTADGQEISAFSIYGLDLGSGATFTVVPPQIGVQIGNPSFAHTEGSRLVFEVLDEQQRQVTIMAADLFTGRSEPLVNFPLDAGPGFPSFFGDDRSVAFAVPDPNAASGASLMRILLANDGVSPAAPPVAWLTDASIGVMYRRGTLPAPGGDGGSPGGGSGGDSGSGDSGDSGSGDSGGSPQTPPPAPAPGPTSPPAPPTSPGTPPVDTSSPSPTPETEESVEIDEAEIVGGAGCGSAGAGLIGLSIAGMLSTRRRRP